MTAARSLRTLLARLAWLVLATLIAFGGAGLVAAMDHAPTTAARPELTWAGDQAAEPALDAATAQLQQLATDVETLGTSARLALAQVVAGDMLSLQQTITNGSLQLSVVQTQTTALDASLAAVPGTGDGAELRLSANVRQRYDELATTQGLTIGLAADWAAFTGRAIDAAKLSGLLSQHDTQTAAAAKEGAAAHYQAALKQLDSSDATMTQALQLRDRLASTTDVSTLTEWLNRNATYDKALRTLYQSLIDAKGVVTSAVRTAFADEQTARAQLPGDTRGLVLIMADVAQGGLNQAVISIEQARGSLNAALNLQQQLREGNALPG